MSAVALDWHLVVWDHAPGAGEGRTFYRSREAALDAACSLPRRDHTALRIEGPNGEPPIDREAIERHCKSRPRRP
jgi:hypothetical protein